MHMCIRQGEIERAKAVDFNFEGLEINPAPNTLRAWPQQPEGSSFGCSDRQRPVDVGNGEVRAEWWS